MSVKTGFFLKVNQITLIGVEEKSGDEGKIDKNALIRDANTFINLGVSILDHVLYEKV